MAIGLLLLVVVAVCTLLTIARTGRVPVSLSVAGPEEALPRPRMTEGLSVAEALAARRSHRQFAATPLTAVQVGQLCWAAQGITDETQGLRTAPSAGGLYPLTIFVVDREGVHEYRPQRHALRRIRTDDVRSELQTAALNQSSVGSAPVCFVITMDVGRTASKYGRRAERYCLLEAGHVAQNILLQATALKLAGVPIGAFEDRKVAAVLNLPSNLSPVYLLPIGVATER